MTRNTQETENLMKGLVTRLIERKIDGENKEIVALFEKNFQDLAWNALEGKDEDQRSTNIFLISMAQERGTKINKSGRFRRSKAHAGGRRPIAGGKIPLPSTITYHWCQGPILSILGFCSKKVKRPTILFQEGQVTNNQPLAVGRNLPSAESLNCNDQLMILNLLWLPNLVS